MLHGGLLSVWRALDIRGVRLKATARKRTNTTNQGDAVQSFDPAFHRPLSRDIWFDGGGQAEKIGRPIQKETS